MSVTQPSDPEEPLEAGNAAQDTQQPKWPTSRQEKTKRTGVHILTRTMYVHRYAYSPFFGGANESPLIGTRVFPTDFNGPNVW